MKPSLSRAAQPSKSLVSKLSKPACRPTAHTPFSHSDTPFGVRSSVLGILLALNALLFFAHPTVALDLLVYNNDDSGPGSLRQAIIDNNASGSDTIVFSNVVTGTITLTSGELLINKALTIVGPGPTNLAVNGNGASRVFHITSNAITVFISDLTITNGLVSGSFPGNVGGGIWNDHATLTLSNCVISGNSGGNGPGGGIFNDGAVSTRFADLRIIASTVSGNSGGGYGGGIWNYGYQGTAYLSINSSTVSGNSATGNGSFGGGIYNEGTSGLATLSVIASTFSSNSASQFGGAIYVNGAGSGNGAFSANASTFSGNSAALGGGIFIQGVGGTAQVQITTTIFKTGLSGANIVNNGGTVSSAFGYNLSSDNGGGVLTNSTDKLNTDPLLGPLADNGGPTLTHALLPGSPAIDQGKSFGQTTDQRGEPRPFNFPAIANANGGDGSDIGAFEVIVRPRFTSIAPLTDNSIQLEGAGLSNLTHTIQANSNLNTTNWTSIGTAPADGSGVFSFTDTNAPLFPMRFYRAVSP
jgi:predicted outer membrane repeat protein